MKNLKKFALGTLIASNGLMIANTPAQAALLGDTVKLDLLANGSLFFNGTAVVVDPGVEFTIPNDPRTFSVDVFSDSFTITYDFSQETFGGTNPLGFLLSDLDWVDTPGVVTGVTLTSGDSNFIAGTSFTSDSVTVDFIGTDFPIQTATSWTFDIQTSHQSTPEPSTMLGLLTLAGFGLGSRFKRKIG